MTFGNSFAYWNNMSYGFGCNNYYNYSPYNYGSYMRYNSYTPLFSFNYGMGSGYGNYYSSSYYGGYSGLYNNTNFSYFNPFMYQYPTYGNVNTGWYNTSSGYYSYSPSPGDGSLYSQFLSITSKYSSGSLGRSSYSSQGSVGSISLGAADVGTAKNITAYTTNNKQQNAGKLAGLSAFKDNTGRVEMCNPAVVDTLVDLSKEAEKRGYKIVVISSFRTYSEQVNLVNKKGQYGKKRSSGGVGVAASAGTSPHEYGQAVDIAVYKGNTKINISAANTPWILDCLKKHSMTWGGDYKSVKEPWHFNTSNASAYRAKLRSGSALA